jgi:hemerythrin
MALIEWKSEFSLGVPQVDTEHKDLIDLINRLHQAAQSREHNATIVDFLEKLYAGAARHFAHEELMMQARRYTAYEAHRTDHQRLLNEVATMIVEYKDGALNNTEDMATRLYDWFCIHFKSYDAPLHRLVHSYIKL